jgi:hypothetical protein
MGQEVQNMIPKKLQAHFKNTPELQAVELLIDSLYQNGTAPA